MKKKIILTGASGFLGANVLELFESRGYNVKCLQNQTKFENLNDWANYFRMEFDSFVPDAVINIGSSQVSGDSFEEIDLLTNANVVAPSYMASYLQEKNPGAQFITISTSWQYDCNGGYKPFNLYAASKQALDDYLMHYALAGLRVTSLILFDTYSKSDTRRKIHNLIRSALVNGETLDMTAGDQVINYTHVSDVAEAVLGAFTIREEKQSEYTGFIRWAIKSPNTLKVKDLLLFVSDKSKLTRIRLGARGYRDREIFKIFEEFETVPGWVPRVDFDSGMTEVLN